MFSKLTEEDILNELNLLGESTALNLDDGCDYGAED